MYPAVVTDLIQDSPTVQRRAARLASLEDTFG